MHCLCSQRGTDFCFVKLFQILVLIGIFSMTLSMILSAPIILFPARMCFHELLRECISHIPGKGLHGSRAATLPPGLFLMQVLVAGANKLSGTFYRVAETIVILGAVRRISMMRRNCRSEKRIVLTFH